MQNKITNLVIVGLGVTGYATLEYCMKQGYQCQVVDSRESPPNFSEIKTRYPNLPIHTGDFKAPFLKEAEIILLSPGISQTDPALIKQISPTAKIIGDIELFAKNATAPIIAITGSNGKSTVTTLVGEMAKAGGFNVGVGGNLGKPSLSLLEAHRELYVLELSSFQLETTYSLKSVVSTLLNITPDHMDRYDNLKSYLDAKLRIFQHAEKMVVNREDELVLNALPKHLPQISFGLDKPNDDNYGVIDQMLYKGKQPLLPISELKIFGKHNVANALAALALGESAGLSLEPMLSVLRQFQGIAHRTEFIRTLSGVKWINDSKGTNVGATVAALKGLSNEIKGQWILIAGGLAKNADFAPLKPEVIQYCRGLVLIGEAASELEDLFKNKIQYLKAKDMNDAVLKAKSLAQTGDGVLLSPACASFDMFKNFEDRGEAFRKAVLAL